MDNNELYNTISTRKALINYFLEGTLFWKRFKRAPLADGNDADEVDEDDDDDDEKKVRQPLAPPGPHLLPSSPGGPMPFTFKYDEEEDEEAVEDEDEEDKEKGDLVQNPQSVPFQFEIL